jgi:glycogen debranching enzyme
MGAPPIPAEARGELLVLKAGTRFLCARPDGDLSARELKRVGLYADDMRYLSRFTLSFGQTKPVLLSHSLESGHRATVNATNPDLRDLRGAPVAQETLNLRRTLIVEECLYCQLELHNYGPRTVALPLEIGLEADFADIFEIRGVSTREHRGRALPPRVEDEQVVFSYRAPDGVVSDTVVAFDVPPSGSEADGERATLRWELQLEPRRPVSLLLSVAPSPSRSRRRARDPRRACRRLDAQARSWSEGCTQIDTDNELFQALVDASLRDLHALITPTGDGRLLAAGIPWYVAPFGRDSLLAAYQCLMLTPQLARDTLLVLAGLQARAEEPWRDAEPGKILHELRSGELARLGLIPHTPYYGTVDATPLFVMLAASYHRWSGDLETLASIRLAIDRALQWIDSYGDLDGDGFVEYERRSPAGLRNQGWKDSEDSIVHADGSLAQGPIALVEVQGYVYRAKTEIADLYDAFGEADRARELRRQAQQLGRAFNDAFWNPQEGTFALALDGRKHQVASVTSNPGHCLYCGIVQPSKAAALADRLMAADMFAGWGVRTLSADSPAYNPMSYHNGSIWPHDNAIIAAGFKRYGLTEPAQRIAGAVYDIATHSRDSRLAELYCGFDRSHTAEIVDYPVACMPQAWAAAAPFMLLQAILGINAHAPQGTLEVIQPDLPAWLQRTTLRGLRVGEATVGLAFARHDGVTAFSLVDQQGQVNVTMSATPR